MPRRANTSTQTRRLLHALYERPRAWRHGYDLSKETGLQSGTLYPVLARLSDQGLLEHEWEPSELPGRPPRHVYRLTAAGVVVAREAAAEQARAVQSARPRRTWRPRKTSSTS
jgi:DNA-binding PadR family transcriptional regulator